MLRILFTILLFLLLTEFRTLRCQNPFIDRTFDGGVCGFGFTATPGPGSGTVDMRWIEGMEIIEAYAVTHRYGRPEPYSMFINGFEVEWNLDNQYGVETIAPSPLFYYATHVAELDPTIFNSDQCSFELPPSNEELNTGYWSIYILILYTHPSLEQPVRVTSFLSDQPVDVPQSYTLPNFIYDDEFDVGFAVHADRLSGFFIDRSRASINDIVIGDFYTPDEQGSESTSGAKGHFYYENGELFGLDDDFPNNSFDESDVIARVNDFILQGTNNDITIRKVSQIDYGNVHPSNYIISTPNCTVSTNTVTNTISLCIGQSTTLTALEGYENYEWTPATGLDDPFSQNPNCSADYSTWYRVRMWNEDGCTQTIPIHVIVNDIPRPENLNIQASTCPANTGFIGLNNPSGRGSFTYTVNGESQNSPEFSFLAPGIYDVSVESSTGCSWDSTLTIPLDPPQEAIFESRPESGYTPLETVFINQSTNAEFYTWLINGEIVSDSRNFGQTFSDPGTYEISLVAYVGNENCADTASFILIVNQGLEMIIPNIITPNGDGQNDQLVAQVFGAESIRWNIFDRWGKELFSGDSSSIEENLVLWTPDNETKDGQYFLVAVGVGEDGRRQEVKAAVTVTR